MVMIFKGHRQIMMTPLYAVTNSFHSYLSAVCIGVFDSMIDWLIDLWFHQIMILAYLLQKHKLIGLEIINIMDWYKNRFLIEKNLFLSGKKYIKKKLIRDIFCVIKWENFIPNDQLATTMDNIEKWMKIFLSINYLQFIMDAFLDAEYFSHVRLSSFSSNWLACQWKNCLNQF